MPTIIRDIQFTNESQYPYIVEENVSVSVYDGGVVRCNIFMPRAVREGQKFPVIMTYGPYGKDIHYNQ
jgi:predicted acyl esterase